MAAGGNRSQRKKVYFCKGRQNPPVKRGPAKSRKTPCTCQDDPQSVPPTK